MSSVQLTNVSTLPAPLSVPIRNICITLALTICTLAATGYFWRETGYEMLIVTMGWPHVILGFVFSFGRVLRGEADSRAAFSVLAFATLTIWLVHYHYPITGLIYLYFLFHLFRDEVLVYAQTRARHRSRSNVYAIAGLGPLILLLLLIPQQQDFRQDMRLVEFSGDQVSSGNWTLIPFRPVQGSSGRQFYFYIQAPQTTGIKAFVTQASGLDLRSDGDLLVGDHRWPQASDLVFQPHYDSEAGSAPNNLGPLPADHLPVLLTGGHRVGQTFTAEKNNLSGIWMSIKRLDQSAENTRFMFHLASPPLLPYSAILNGLRDLLILILTGIVLWRLIPRRGWSSQLWIYLAVLAGSFALAQSVLKSSSNAGYPFPLIFQFAVVFHYWSWYVFSFDKLRCAEVPQHRESVASSAYDKVLGLLRQGSYFTITVIALNLISAIGVLWYYQFGGSGVLRYFFDYSCFLYILVFHVTFSFRPKLNYR